MQWQVVQLFDVLGDFRTQLATSPAVRNRRVRGICIEWYASMHILTLFVPRLFTKPCTALSVQS